MKNCETIFETLSALEKVGGRNSHIAKKESENFSLQKFHIVHALVFVEIRVFQKPVLSHVCPHTRLRGIKELTWKTLVF